MSSTKPERPRSTSCGGGRRDVYPARENVWTRSNQLTGSQSQMPCCSWNVGRSAAKCDFDITTRLKMGEEKNGSRVDGEDNEASVSPADSDLEYGPGIVNKLKSRFIHLTQKPKRQQIKRFSSLENLVQDGLLQATEYTKGDRSIVRRNRAKYDLPSSIGKNVKKAQSMETLLCKSDKNHAVRPFSLKSQSLLINENIIIVENVEKCDRSGNLNSKKECSMKSSADEEMPKPDTVETYKRMFEPAETKALHRRRPPVLRASAKLSTNKNGTNVVKNCANSNSDQNNKTVSSISDTNKGKLEANSSTMVNGEMKDQSDRKKLLKSVKTDASIDKSTVVFDFRGKLTKPKVCLQPTPFGCKPIQKSVKKYYRLIDGKESLPKGSEFLDDDDDEDEDDVDGQNELPYPSGITFVGENVKVGKGAFLITKNKNLRIQFNENNISIHEYQSEISFLDNDRINEDNNGDQNGFSGLASYTPRGLDTNSFQLGLSRLHSPQSDVPQINASETEELPDEVLKPADPNSTSSWSCSTTTSDLLF